jgi:AAA domain, putative AbiEii toxin, Type IV TA system/Protein of unknown function (DUF4435)
MPMSNSVTGPVPMARDLALPPPRSSPERSTVRATGSVVIVGANGSGKTRLGAWLDVTSPQAAVTNRIAAQKSLTLPEGSSTSSLDIAEKGLLYGNTAANASALKAIYKWSEKPSTHLQNDFDKLLIFLFTEEFEKSTRYRQQARDPQRRQEGPPETLLDTIKRLWEDVLPHRELLFRAGKIEVQLKGDAGSLYNAAEMSDGERVAFYLIGQSLASKPDGIVVVDEPEIHLHRSLQARLWDAIEAERPDCLFVYLTHDLDFAATRVNATKVCMGNFDGTTWDWHLLVPDENFPERLLLEILGSRKPILFVEGERESLDSFLLSKLFPQHAVTPCGSASAVIHATRSFARLVDLHSLACSGIVDRDFRSDAAVEYLRQIGVACLDVSEIENLLLEEAVLRVVAASLHRDDVDEVIAKAKETVFKMMASDKDRLVSGIAAARIEDGLSQFDAKAKGSSGLAKAFEDLVGGIDVEALFQAALVEVEGILTRRDYKAALKVYNNKGLLPAVSQLFGFRADGLLGHARRLRKTKDNEGIVGALRAAVPEIASLPVSQEASPASPAA